MEKKVFAFDLGKASIGYCVREGHNIKEANSVIIEKDHSDISALRARKHVKRTLDAHKAREKYFQTLWEDCGLTPLSTNDARFKKEFASPGDETIYTSCLLRIALLQNKKLEEWQIYKALRNALQRRGYDPNLPWKHAQTDDDKENLERILKYTSDNGKTLINSEKYQYPCCYDALRLGLWDEDNPETFKRCIPPANNNKVRSTDYVAPREMVERELSQLWKNAQSQLPELNKYSVEEFLYGEYMQAYGSYIDPDYRKYLGTSHDWQGVLGQKIPRFNNRIFSKCVLLPKRNACKADTIENVKLVLLMKLKNLSLTDINGEKIKLSPDEINKVYENWRVKSGKSGKLDTTITVKEIGSAVGRKLIDKFDPLKANISGRSSFCRRACEIMSKVILTGELYPQNMDISEFVDSDNSKNGITEKEIREMFSKIGDWNNLYIPDNRGETAKISESVRTKTDAVIGNITNPIVRNRLQIFRDLLEDLYYKYGKPDEVIFEFVRDGADNSLFGRVKANAVQKMISENEKNNKLIRQELDDIDAYSPANFEKLKLLKIQGGRCIYSGKEISPSDFDGCEIDHIYPRTLGGNDALYNKVLCLSSENQKKAGRTPYEWLSSDKNEWTKYVNRLNENKKRLGKKKYELLTSPPEVCAKLIESYNGLAETSYISKIAQQITALMFDWEMQESGEKRHLFVNNGSSTAAIRKRYGLNSFLGNPGEKNRKNDKHHALDAICISYSRDFKYDRSLRKDVIKDFNPQKVKEVIDSIMPYPYTNKKPLKANTRPDETIYGFRQYGENSYITKRVSLTEIKQDATNIKKILDEVIKNDLLLKLDEKMNKDEWLSMLQNYIHPAKKTHVKKVLTEESKGEIETDSNGRMRIGEYCDFGHNGTQHQFKRSKSHKGQILYYNAKGTVKVMPIYSNIKTAEVKEKLFKLGCKLYNKGEMFYSGCLVNVNDEFKGGAKIYPAGLYKVRTIESEGRAKLENDKGELLSTHVKYLSKAGFSKVRP